ncbi:MAG TPA: hypothetical protein VKT82_22550 [Ktedonobacterales bacterium]|nr:hypothetical protein [Ktedonobacterales bacterium]
MRTSKAIIWMLAALCLALALAACQPGGAASNTGSTGPTSTPAPINVPTGYQGLVQVTFTSTTTYAQAASIIESAGLTLQVPCPNPGPIRPDPTPVLVSQEATFAASHQLTAIGRPSLTRAMLTQVASSSQVTAVNKTPQIECPLLRG